MVFHTICNIINQLDIISYKKTFEQCQDWTDRLTKLDTSFTKSALKKNTIKFSAMLRKEMVHIYDTQYTEGYCDVILIKN